MKYYIFKVTDSIKREYFIVNNVYIGYVGFDSNWLRCILEYNGKVRVEPVKYNLYAQGEVPNGSPNERLLHKLFSGSERLAIEEVKTLCKTIPQLKKTTKKEYSVDYEIYYPQKNCSISYLREIRGELKTIE